jgi:hypothetical protein
MFDVVFDIASDVRVSVRVRNANSESNAVTIAARTLCDARSAVLVSIASRDS